MVTDFFSVIEVWWRNDNGLIYLSEITSIDYGVGVVTVQREWQSLSGLATRLIVRKPFHEIFLTKEECESYYSGWGS